MKSASTKTKEPSVDWGDLTPLEKMVEKFSVVLYGRSGTGKTTLAGTFPKPMLYLDIRDQGTASLRGLKEVYVKEIEDLEDLNEQHRKLVRDPKRFKTVVLDTVSQLQQMVVEELMDTKKVKAGRKVGDWGTMSQGDWGKVTGDMKETIIRFRDLTDYGMNVVFIAQEKRSSNNDGESEGSSAVLTPEAGPSVSPSVALVLNAAVAVVGSTFIRIRNVIIRKEGKKEKKTKIEFCLRLGPNPVYVTKVRKGRDIEVPSVLVNPTYQKIIDTLTGE